MTDAQPIAPTHERLMFLRSKLACRKPRRNTLFVLPWINIALLLFAFHLVQSRRTLSPGIELSLPVAPFTGGAPAGSEVITVLRNGSIYFKDERVPAGQIEEILRRAASAPAGTGSLLIEADRAVTHDQLAAVCNAAQSAGYRAVVLATRLPDADTEGGR